MIVMEKKSNSVLFLDKHLGHNTDLCAINWVIVIELKLLVYLINHFSCFTKIILCVLCNIVYSLFPHIGKLARGFEIHKCCSTRYNEAVS